MNGRLAGGIALGALVGAGALGVAAFFVFSTFGACACSAPVPYGGVVVERADAPPGMYGLRLTQVDARGQTYEGLDLAADGLALRYASEGGDGSWRAAREGAVLPRDARPADGDVLLLDPHGDAAPQVVRFIEHESGAIILTLNGRFTP